MATKRFFLFTYSDKTGYSVCDTHNRYNIHHFSLFNGHRTLADCKRRATAFLRQMNAAA